MRTVASIGVDVAPSVRGPTADSTLLKGSGLLARLPAGVGARGDLAYVGIAEAHPAGLGATPRRKPRGKPRPEADIASTRAFARRRVVAEHLCWPRSPTALRPLPWRLDGPAGERVRHPHGSPLGRHNRCANSRTHGICIARCPGRFGRRLYACYSPGVGTRASTGRAHGHARTIEGKPIGWQPQ
jgi:hypothetical protein